MRRSDALLRIGLCLLASAIMWAATGGWAPPLPYRSCYTPPRDIVARVAFQEPDPEKTREAQREARRNILCVYAFDRRPLPELQQALKHDVFQIVGAKTFSDKEKEVWSKFLPDDSQESPGQDAQQSAFEEFQRVLAADAELTRFEQAVKRAFDELQEHGLLGRLEHELEEGSQTEIIVHDVGNPEFSRRVDVDKVLAPKAAARLGERLLEEFRAMPLSEDAAKNVSQRVFVWLNRRLTDFPTLSLDREATEKLRVEAASRVEQKMISYKQGDLLAHGGQPLTQEQLPLLRLEHHEQLAQRSTLDKAGYSLGVFGMHIALYTLCGYYIARREPRLLIDLRRFGALMGLVVVTVVLSRVASGDRWQAEITPLLLFGMTAAVAYRQELALLLSAAVLLAVVLSLGLGLAEFAIFMAAVSAAILLSGGIRSRTKLIYIGSCAAAAASATAVSVGTLVGQPLGAALISSAAWYGFCSFLAGLLLTALLPFVERTFDVQTDISLLEWGDAAHPLLQELARRAPGTYNHSINVASLAEAAAEAIEANGLLVRVGAYFHDIGKMLKPAYFVENQGSEASRHESLLPAMSTLVIIAHVKDGADLARQHRVPESIVEFINQHHGTTLVEYFYHEAARRSESSFDGARVDETTFRYPGPKPQTKESAVMMLADAVESASRTLVDPTPARIDSLVRDIAKKRLLDGQFDQCSLTLSELRDVEDSLVKSLNAVYHGRVKYPSQQQSA